jgi:hypothetical protein
MNKWSDSMKDLFIQPNIDESKIVLSFTPSSNHSNLVCRIYDQDEVIAESTIDVKPGNGLCSYELTLPRFQHWSVDSPHLYRLKISQLGIDQTFGMTKIHVKDRKIYFNNMPFYIRGFIRGRAAHDHPNLTGVSPREYYEKNIRMAKAFGFNFVRFHSTVPPIEFLEAADRLGFLCQVEIRKYFGHYQKEREETNFDGDQTLVDEKDWEEMLYVLRNHPCVMVYCMGNEINNPGTNERVRVIRKLTQKLDPTRLFLDTCSRGEYDRDTVDIDVQHMSYFAPFGTHYSMFDDSIHLAIYGSIHGKKMVEQDQEDDPAFILRREVSVKFPLIAHEVCHYNVLRDPYKLDEKFKRYHAEKPWWIDELIKMIQTKGHEKQFGTMLQASTRFQYIWIKQNIESVRKSRLLQGFHFLQLTDTDRYENANGFIDCFDDVKDIPPEKVLPFNRPTVLVADLPQRTFMEKTKLVVPIHISHFASDHFDSGVFRWEIRNKNDQSVLMSGAMDQLDLARRGNFCLCRLAIQWPAVNSPTWLVFSCEINGDNGEKVSNQWDLWLFPNMPERLSAQTISVDLNEVQINKRYFQLTQKQDAEPTEKLLISDHFDEKVLHHLEQGKDALILYRIAENRSKMAPREKYYLPSTWDRFKAIIWDRGQNCGGFLRKSPVVGDFPHDGFIDWQFYHLIEDCDKIDLDDFPVRVEPIIEGVDKAVRDRFDVGRFDLSELQYAYTMRKFAYLFELKVGQGRLIVAGMNFKGIETEVPETCWLFESLINYMGLPVFNPQASLSVEALRQYLLAKGESKRIKERMMTQYWQLDDAPLESEKYWKESEEWLRSDV